MNKVAAAQFVPKTLRFRHRNAGSLPTMGSETPQEDFDLRDADAWVSVGQLDDLEEL